MGFGENGFRYRSAKSLVSRNERFCVSLNSLNYSV